MAYLVNRDVIKRTDSEKIEIIDVSGNFPSLLQLWLAFNFTRQPETYFHIAYWDKGSQVSSGDGPTRQFNNLVIKELSEFIEFDEKFYPMKMTNKFNRLCEDKLYFFGKTIGYLTGIANTNLSFRLPFWLLAQLRVNTRLEEAVSKKRKSHNAVEIPNITDVELMYFSRLQNAVVSNNIEKYQNMPNKFAELGTGHLSWRCALLDLLGWENRLPENKLSHVRNGFNSVKQECVSQMNLPTFDYYISGDLQFDRESFIDHIRIQFDDVIDDEDVKIIRRKWEKYFKTITDDQLAQLVENVYGMNFLKLEHIIHINIVPDDEGSTDSQNMIEICTCNGSVDIPCTIIKKKFNEVMISLCDSADDMFNDM